MQDLVALFPGAVMTKMVYDQGSAGTYGFVEFGTREEVRCLNDMCVCDAMSRRS